MKYITLEFMKSKALNIFAILITAAILFVACTKEDKDVRLDPILSTSETTNITNTSANVIGFITSHGSGFTEKGVCYSLTATPTIETATKVVCLVDTITATFEVKLTGLDFATKYYARAYAISPSGIMYGEEVSFTTLPNVPTVTTADFISNTSKTANGGGSVTDDGRGVVTKRGVCYSVLPNPTLEHCKDSITDDGKGLGTFTSSLSKLTAKTKYYVRAYATNSGGTGYGPEVSFTTLADALFMIGDGVGTWDWATTDLPMIQVNSHTNLFWKIVWLNATGEFKFAPQKAWSGDFGKTGSATDGVYSKGGDNIPVPGTAGYYMVVVDIATGKIAIADPKVYLMGETIGSWDTQNAAGLFTVDNANSVITITKSLAAKELRMYAWHPWFTDWWQSEFMILNGKIEFRGTGNDQARVTPTAGNNKIDLNFKTGDGSITLIP